MRRHLWILAVLLLAGCGGEQAAITPTAAPTPQRAMLRVQNTSATDIEALVVIFPDERISVGPIGAGETTEYQPAQKGVYRYAALELRLKDTGAFNYPVTDWMGEHAATQGFYTLNLSIDMNKPDPWERVTHTITSP